MILMQLGSMLISMAHHKGPEGPCVLKSEEHDEVCTLLALGELILSLTGHCSGRDGPTLIRDNPIPQPGHERTGPNGMVIEELALPFSLEFPVARIYQIS